MIPTQSVPETVPDVSQVMHQGDTPTFYAQMGKHVRVSVTLDDGRVFIITPIDINHSQLSDSIQNKIIQPNKLEQVALFIKRSFKQILNKIKRDLITSNSFVITDKQVIDLTAGRSPPEAIDNQQVEFEINKLWQNIKPYFLELSSHSKTSLNPHHPHAQDHSGQEDSSPAFSATQQTQTAFSSTPLSEQIIKNLTITMKQTNEIDKTITTNIEQLDLFYQQIQKAVIDKYPNPESNDTIKPLMDNFTQSYQPWIAPFIDKYEEIRVKYATLYAELFKYIQEIDPKDQASAQPLSVRLQEVHGELIAINTELVEKFNLMAGTSQELLKEAGINLTPPATQPSA